MIDDYADYLEVCGTRLINHFFNQHEWPQPKIIGGYSTPYGAYPWQVELQANIGGWEHHCGGALVSETIALTAAHCLKNLKKSQLRILVGKHNLSKNDKHEKTYKIQKILVHPDFRKDGPHSHDIAVLKLHSANSKGVRFDSHVQPICLPEYHTNINEANWCTVTGWGAQKQDDMTSLSKVLQAASVHLIDLETCRHDDIYGGRHQFILDSMLCAGNLEGGVDACGGDSGGPLACQINGKFVLTGVVSWGDGCGKKNRPGVYTRVSYYADWLKQSIFELET
ncbi:prostasin-like isoform X2 [Daktulosphaira vitifoliae]|uniref:prostasin-like isoform X2 n=1 Tax=Daktulosphaira vitifoliae TaxID=58002 RepID=UPI0021AA5329|nr:prostasin-like isoform X2 [Daktulosphaira vitifoliae]